MLAIKRSDLYGLAICVSLVSVSQLSLAEDPELTRVFYPHHEKYFRAYSPEELGKAIHVTPFIVKKNAKAPAEPSVVEGQVLHRFPGSPGFDDDKFIQSSTGEAPALAWEDYKKRLVKKMAGDWKFTDSQREFDIEGKWIEAQFLAKVAPKMSAPDTHIITEFDTDSISKNEKKKIEQKVKKVMKQYKLKGDEIADKLYKAEAYRSLIEERLGKSIVKGCFACGSTKRLPWTDEDWLDTYAEYLRDLDKNPDDTSNEGWVIDRLIKKPFNSIAQKGIKLKQEVRVHILNGKVIKGGSFIRYNQVTDDLPPEELTKIENAVEEHFLANLKKLGPDFEKFNATPDVAIADGRYYIIDLNAGIDSGFYHPNFDIITSNLVTQSLTGKSTPFLDQFEKYKAMPMGKEKVAALRAIRHEYPKFTTTSEEQHGQLWYRIIDNYY